MRPAYDWNPRDEHTPDLSLFPSSSYCHGGTKHSWVRKQYRELGHCSHETQASQKNPIFKILILSPLQGQELVSSCVGVRDPLASMSSPGRTGGQRLKVEPTEVRGALKTSDELSKHDTRRWWMASKPGPAPGEESCSAALRKAGAFKGLYVQCEGRWEITHCPKAL